MVASLEQLEGKATGPRGPRKKASGPARPIPVDVVGPGAPPPGADAEKEAKAAAAMRSAMNLAGVMLARIPVAFFELPPALSPAEEQTMSEALVAVADHYLPDWLKSAGPLAALATSAAMVYGPRVMDKVDRLEAERLARKKKAEEALARAAHVQPPGGTESADRGPLGLGKDLFSEAASQG